MIRASIWHGFSIESVLRRRSPLKVRRDVELSGELKLILIIQNKFLLCSKIKAWVEITLRVKFDLECFLLKGCCISAILRSLQNISLPFKENKIARPRLNTSMITSQNRDDHPSHLTAFSIRTDREIRLISTPSTRHNDYFQATNSSRCQDKIN